MGRESLDIQTNLPLEARLKYLDHFEGEHGARTKIAVVVKGSDHYPEGEWNVWLAGWAMDALVEQGAAIETGTKPNRAGIPLRQFKVQNQPFIQILRREEKGDDNKPVKRTNISLVSGGKPPAAPTMTDGPENDPPPRQAPPSSPPDGNIPHQARAAHDADQETASQAETKTRQRGIFKAWLGVADAYRTCLEMAIHAQACAFNIHPSQVDQAAVQAGAATMLIQTERANLVGVVPEFPGLPGTMRDYLESREPMPAERGERWLQAEAEKLGLEWPPAPSKALADPTPAGAPGSGEDNDDLPF